MFFRPLPLAIAVIVSGCIAVAGCSSNESESQTSQTEANQLDERPLGRGPAGGQDGETSLLQGDGPAVLKVYAREVVDAWNTQNEEKFAALLCAKNLSEDLPGDGEMRSLEEFPFEAGTTLSDPIVEPSPHVFDPKNSPSKVYSKPGDKYQLRQAMQGGVDATSTTSDWPVVGMVFYAVELSEGGWCLHNLGFGTAASR